jgi:hypothetical protein
MGEMKKSSDDVSDPLQEAMRRIQEAEATGAGKLDLSNLGLGPVLRGDWDGCEELRRLDNLWKLDLGENQITYIPDEGWIALGRMVALYWLDLMNNQMDGRLLRLRAEHWELYESTR